jgi:hypothetical protein
LFDWFAATRVARRVTDAVVRAWSRRHLACFDQAATDRCQTRTLLGLLHRAQSTRFGIEHDFRRIRTPEDFRRLVPVRSRADLWRTYWQPTFPELSGTTWPGPLPPPALLKAPGDLVPIPVCLSTELLAAHRATLRTALAFVVSARPRARLLAGQLLLLGEDLAVPGGADLAHEGVPFALRPYTHAGIGWNWGERRTTAFLKAPAAASVRSTVTCLAGPAARLVRFLEAAKQSAGEDRLSKIWPMLTAILCVRQGPESLPTALRQLADENVLLLEMGAQPEGVIAVTDPRHGAMRLLTDHGTYFEFIPSTEVGKPAPVRHSLGQVETGVPYELVMSSPAGAWACRVSVTVCFDRRDPPLLRFVEAISATSIKKPALTKEEVKARVPHRRNDDIPAVLPEKFAHSPWSIPADRG